MKARHINLSVVQLEPHPSYANGFFLRSLMVEEPPLELMSDAQIMLLQMTRPLLCTAETEKHLQYLSPPHYVEEFKRRGIEKIFVQIIVDQSASEIVMADQFARLVDNRASKQEAALAMALEAQDMNRSMCTAKWPKSYRVVAKIAGLTKDTVRKEVLASGRRIADARRF